MNHNNINDSCIELLSESKGLNDLSEIELKGNVLLTKNVIPLFQKMKEIHFPNLKMEIILKDFKHFLFDENFTFNQFLKPDKSLYEVMLDIQLIKSTNESLQQIQNHLGDKNFEDFFEYMKDSDIILNKLLFQNTLVTSRIFKIFENKTIIWSSFTIINFSIPI